MPRNGEVKDGARKGVPQGRECRPLFRVNSAVGPKVGEGMPMTDRGFWEKREMWRDLQAV